MWAVEFTDEFGAWWDGLTKARQDAVTFGVDLIGRFGPALGRPHVDGLAGSRHPNLKELRVQSGGRPIRVFFAFDPRRHAILLLGGDKTGDSRFYRRMIPLADRLYDEYLEELRKEGLL